MKINNYKTTDADKQLILSTLDSFKNKKILVLGDIGVDEYILGNVRRISPEAPVPVLEVESEDIRLGLAANVAQNIASLGGQAILISIMGEDSGAESLKRLLKEANVSSENLVCDNKRPTTRKARVMTGHHHLVRVDYELKNDITSEIESLILARVEKVMASVDTVVLEDYAKGFMTASLVEKVCQIAHTYKKKVFVDPHRTHKAEFYKGADLFKPNLDESLDLAGINYDEYKKNPEASILQVGEILKQRTGAAEIILTQGKEGMTLFSKNEIVKVPTFARQVFDVTGAGDTVIAALTLGSSAGLSLTHSCILANYAAGVVVGQVGCVPCTKQDLIQYIRES